MDNGKRHSCGLRRCPFPEFLGRRRSGLFDCYSSLGLFEDTERPRSGFKENIRPLYKFLETEGIPSIPNRRQLTRATRDQHINADGNPALPLNISDFILSQFPTLATESDPLP